MLYANNLGSENRKRFTVQKSHHLPSNHLLTTGIDDPSLTGAQVIIKVSGHHHRWLAGGYDLEIGHF